VQGSIFPVIFTPIKSIGETASVTASNGSTPDRNDSQKDGSSPKSDSVDFNRFVKETGPADGVEFGKLLVWAFIAGFAERFVPDTLDRMVARAKDDKSGSSSGG
jgi:hypothetical protein